MVFLENYEKKIDTFLKPEAKRHTTTARITNIIASLFLGAGAVYAYRAAYQYVAIGLGALSLISLLFAPYKQPTPVFKKFSEDCELAAAHLTNAFISKAQFMIDQINAENSTWDVSKDKALSEAYEFLGITKNHLDGTLISSSQESWAQAHEFLKSKIEPIIQNASITTNVPELKSLIDKVQKAGELFLFGQSPQPKDLTKQTYVEYLTNNTARSWSPFSKI
ncbi:MAG: hypothetical protein ACRDF4_00835 [Rhabdochlamydiaceae bacterium]